MRQTVTGLNKKPLISALLSGLFVTSIISCSSQPESVAEHQQTIEAADSMETESIQVTGERLEGDTQSELQVGSGAMNDSSLREKVPSERNPKEAVLGQIVQNFVAQTPQRMVRKAVVPTKSIYQIEQINNENYQRYSENGVWTVSDKPVSTFSVDVDTASYTNVRRMLQRGIMPPKDAVRVEEFVNYFNYDYPQPKNEHPFFVDTTLQNSPYNKDRHLLRVALSGQQIDFEDRQASNLVFLIDVSGSMGHDDKLPLLKRAFKMMLSKLDEDDSVAIVVYAGASGVVLEPTPGNEHLTISQALDNLKAGGATNGASGIELAYQLAQKAYKKNNVNRVILATDGDFNVGMTDQDKLLDLIEKRRELGINLSVLGFGSGNYNDALTEQLADKGNGNASYIDNINEARKVLVEQLTGTLQVIAKDVKIQVEFNPSVVHEYRLIGYENRQLSKEDFNNDKVDAGEIGAGHKVTALYEVTLKSAQNYTIDESRYQSSQNAIARDSSELAVVKLRYKQPTADISQRLEQIVTLDNENLKQTDPEFQFASAVAGFAQILRGSKFVNNSSIQSLIQLARDNKGDDEQGYRAELIQLMENWRLIAQTEVRGKSTNKSAWE